MASNDTNEGASTFRLTKRARKSAINVKNKHDILFENDSNCSYVSLSDESMDDIDTSNALERYVPKLAHCRFKG